MTSVAETVDVIGSKPVYWIAKGVPPPDPSASIRIEPSLSLANDYVMLPNVPEPVSVMESLPGTDALLLN